MVCSLRGGSDLIRTLLPLSDAALAPVLPPPFVQPLSFFIQPLLILISTRVSRFIPFRHSQYALKEDLDATLTQSS